MSIAEPAVTQPRPDAGARPVATTTRRRRTRPGTVVLYVVLALGLLLTVVPFLYMLVSSFKSQGDILAHPTSLWPSHPTLENYRTWFTDLHIGRFFFNSLFVALVTMAGNIVFCSMVGYALAKMEFAGKRLLFALVMITLMTPGIVTLVPLFVLVTRLGLLNTYAALILPFLTTPVGVFLMRQFMQDIPDSLLEAARLDGAGEIRTFVQVVMPLCGPPIATLGILSFLGSWNNFLWPVIATQTDSKYTLPVALSLYSTGQEATNYGLLLAGAVLVITPIVLLFLFFQRYFVQSVAGVGIK